MNSGKSTALMQVAHNYEERGMCTAIIKPKIDTKGNDQIVSRLGVTRQVDAQVSSSDSLKDIVQNLEKKGTINCILVDEAQFFTTSQVDEMFEIAVKKDIPIICYGLRTDFLANGFEGSKRLLLLAHTIEELKTICRCGRKAVLNGRTINGKFVFEGDQVAIDGEAEVTYESLCATCYYKYRADERNLSLFSNQ